MPIQAAYAVPHPPLIVPSVGRGEENEIAATIAAYEEVARRIAAHAPDVLVVVSPHAPLYRDAFFVSGAPVSAGSMVRFGVPQERLEVKNDTDFQQLLAERLERVGIFPACGREAIENLDHAAFVPLYFVRDLLPETKLVRVGLSGLPATDHEQVGREIAAVTKDLGRNAVVIASGDLSHKLTADGPYGFNAAGPIFDEKVTGILGRGALDELFGLNEQLCEEAAECGLRSYQIMAGVLEDADFTSELLSYEGPFGVGYSVAAFEVADTNASKSEGIDVGVGVGAGSGVDGFSGECADAVSGECAREGNVVCEELPEADPLVALARETVEKYTRNGEVPLPPETVQGARAGVFVSLHEGEDLRGCIGTIEATQTTLAEEVISNAVSACSRDPRFTPVRPDELDFISYSVDVLMPAVPVDALSELDPERYGVIVTLGRRRGLLLPALEGVDTVEQQLAIAMQKAGIPVGAPGVQIEKFEVVRHNIGGQARCRIEL